MRVLVGGFALVVLTSASPALAQQGTAELRGQAVDSQKRCYPA